MPMKNHSATPTDRRFTRQSSPDPMKRSEKLQLIHAIVMQSNQFNHWYAAEVAVGILNHTGWRIGKAKRMARKHDSNRVDYFLTKTEAVKSLYA